MLNVKERLSLFGQRQQMLKTTVIPCKTAYNQRCFFFQLKEKQRIFFVSLSNQMTTLSAPYSKKNAITWTVIPGQKQTGKYGLDYSPFGALMPGRNTNAGSYRHGYQGQECDPEISGEGNSYAFEYRFHDPRLGRFLSIDPLAASFAYNSPYAFSENKVMHCIELEGLEAWPVNGEAKDLMSQEGWQNFNHAEVQRLTAPEVQDRMKFDCVDFVVHMWVSYYQSEGVAMPMIKAGGITIDFYDPKYKDKPELFMRDMKRAIGGNIDDLFMKRIPTSEATFGDVIYQPDVHASMVYNDEKLLSDYRANLSSLGMDPNIKIYGYAQGSGYDTEGYGTAPGLDPLEVKVDWGNYWAPTYRLNFVRELPRTEQMETVNSIKVTSLKIQNGTTAAETSR